MSVWNSASLIAQHIMMQIQPLIFLHIPARIGHIEASLIAECNWQLFPEVKEEMNCLSFVTSCCPLISSELQTDKRNCAIVHMLFSSDLAPV